MPSFTFKTLRAKLIATLLPIVVLGVAAMTTLAITRASSTQRESADAQLLEQATAVANSFDGQSREAASIGRTVAAQLRDSDGLSRATVRSQLHRVLNANPRIAAVYAGFEPNAFDGSDAAHLGDADQAGAGRFMPYWNTLAGKAKLEPLADADTSSYYAGPKKTGRDAVVEPYIYDGALMTSYVSPIMRKGTFVGIGGVDVLLDRLQREVSGVKVLDTGYALAVSNAGVIAAGPASQKSLLGKGTIQALATKRDDSRLAGIAAAVRGGKRGVLEATDPFSGKPVTIAYAPVATGKWSMIVIAPTSEVLASVHTLRNALIIAALIITLIAAAAVAIVSGRLTRPLKGLVSRLRSLGEQDLTSLRTGIEAIAEGDLTVRAASETQAANDRAADEIGQASRTMDELIATTTASIDAYNTSRESLAAMIGQVSVAATDVSSGSQQMAATAEEAGRAVGEIAHAIGEVAAGAQRQVEGVEAARAAVEQVSAVSDQSAKAAQDATDAAEQARSIATDGSASVRQATEAMASVRDASQQATEAIRGLGTKSGEIGGIVDTIGGIAEQTNLLALNAAIEAARAGEQGRGFAVVADEVRKLAEESRQASQSIASLIGEIQAETGKAIDVVEAGGRRTDEGAATVEEARVAFDAIGASVDDVTNRVAEIASAIAQVAASATSVRDDMTDVSAVAEESSATTEQVSASTQETSASTEEISASATALAQTATELDELVRRFKIST
jgi:methyl-accepting chemotaxis protein